MSRDRATDTIVAIATPPGRGALAIVRASGPDALEFGRRLFRPWPADVRRATHSRAMDAAGHDIDDGVVVWYAAPRSFTGEDAFEFTCHGGPVAPAAVVAAFVALGARPADPGEFTRRALLNGKLDLLQAEAVADLVDAATQPAHRVALAQLDGGLSRRITELREHILGLEALAAYDIDFPEEDDGPVSPARIRETCNGILAELDRLLATAPVGEIVRDGAVVVIAGEPNVGKSSLFNALLGRRRAIVTDVPGTTRDAIEAMTEADGWPVRLVDTAGLREDAQPVERLGIEVSREYLGRADIVLVCGDSDDSLRRAADVIGTPTRAIAVRVRTKSDVNRPSSAARDGRVVVSAETGEGLADLRRAIADALASAKGALTLDAPLVTRERHRHALERAREELREFRAAWDAGAIPPVVAAVHLRDATRMLEELIGVVDVEDVLDRVFSAFCVGK